MAYLLDTNIISDLVRQPSGPVRHAIARVGQENVCTSILVAAELGYGVLKKGASRLGTRVDAILADMDILPLEPPFQRHYADVRLSLESIGRPIGHMDTMIAAHALAIGCVLVTDNMAEFARVPGLAVENWLR